jgi:hypothetical protein
VGPGIGEAGSMVRKITILLVAASLAACASPEIWHKSGVSQQDVNADTTACQSAARRSSEGTSFVYAHVTSYNYFNNCMADRGYLVSIF